MSWGFSSLVNSVSALVNPEPQIAVNGEDKIKQAAEQALLDLQNSPPFFTRMQGPEACFEYYRQRIFTVLKGPFPVYEYNKIEADIEKLRQQIKANNDGENQEKKLTAQEIAEINNKIDELIKKKKEASKKLDWDKTCHQILNGIYLGGSTAAIQATQENFRFFSNDQHEYQINQEEPNPFDFKTIISICSATQLYKDELEDQRQLTSEQILEKEKDLRKRFEEACTNLGIQPINLSEGVDETQPAQFALNSFNWGKTSTKQLKTMSENKMFLSYFLELFRLFDQAVIEGKEPILVHCREGSVRSASLILLYLVFRFDLSVNEAFKYLAAMRPQVKTQKTGPFYDFIVTSSKEIRIAKLKKEIEEVVKASKVRDVARKDSDTAFDQICGDLYLGDRDGLMSVCPRSISRKAASPDNCNPGEFESLITLDKFDRMSFEESEVEDCSNKIEKLGVNWSFLADTLVSSSPYWSSLVHNCTINAAFSLIDKKTGEEQMNVLKERDQWLKNTDVKEWFQSTFAKLEDAFLGREKTLVHCGSGKTLSPALLIAFFIHLGFSYEDAAIFISSKRRVDLAPFANHLKAYEVALRKDVPYAQALAAVELTCN